MTTLYPAGRRLHNGSSESWAQKHTLDADSAYTELYLMLDNCVTGSPSWVNLTRIYLPVDTTALGTIISATIRLKIHTALEVRNFVATLTPQLYLTTLASPPTVAVTDWQEFTATQVSDGIVGDLTSLGSWVEYPLNAAGIATLNAAGGGYVTFLLALDKDILNVEPDNGYNRYYKVRFETENAPEIVIVNTTMVVQTNPATNISSGNAQLNGNLTDDGAEASVTVSFVAGTTSACSDWAGGAQAGTEGADFDAIITGLVPGQTIYFKAKAVGGDSGLIVYGAVLSFTLGNYPSKPLTRVMGIRDVFKAGMNGQGGQYYHDLLLGGLQTDWIPSFDKWEASVEGGENPQTKEKKLPEVFSDPNYLAHGMDRTRNPFGQTAPAGVGEDWSTRLFSPKMLPTPEIQRLIDKMKKDAEGK